MHGERGWEEPLVKIAKSYHNGVAYLYISMRNLIIITTSSREILETRNLLKSCKIERYLGKTWDWEVEAGVSLGGLGEMEHIC